MFRHGGHDEADDLDTTLAHPGGARARVAGVRRPSEPGDAAAGSADVSIPLGVGSLWDVAVRRPGDASGPATASPRDAGDAAVRDLADGAVASETPDAPAGSVPATAAGDGGPQPESQRTGWVPERTAPRVTTPRRRARRAARTRRGPQPATRAGSPDATARSATWRSRLVDGGPWGALAEKWIPEPLRGARVDPGRRGAVVLSIVAAIAAVAAAVGVWWSRPTPTPLGDASVSPVTEPATPAPAGAGGGLAFASGAVTSGAVGPTAATPTETQESGPILVSVTGKVRRPGLVTVQAGARVADAIAAAGGALDDAALTGLNLAARLADGTSIVVAGDGGTVAGPTAESVDPVAGDGAKINLNAADAAALQTLPGVGPVTAAAIIAYRKEHGPFADIAQLEEVSGIGPATLARLRPHVTL